MNARACLPLAAATLASCSLLELEDLELEPCERDRDCYVVTPDPTERLACQRCVQGRCERRGSLKKRVVATLEEHPTRLAATSNGDGQTVLLLTSPEGLFGWELAADRAPEEMGPVAYPSSSGGSICPVVERGQPVEKGCRLREHALSAVSPARWLGASVNVSGCQNGQLRLGLSAPRAPMDLNPYSALGPIAGGVETNTDACTHPNGASAPAVASLPLREGRTHALVVWQATPSTTGAKPGRCAMPNAQIPIHGLPLVVVDGEDRATVEPAFLDEPSRVYAEAAATVEPQVVAVSAGDVTGFVLAYASAHGLVLQPVGAPEFDLHEPVTSSEEDIRFIRITPATPGASSQDFVVSWIEGCSAPRVRAAAYRWTKHGLEPVMRPVTLGKRIAGADHLSMAYADHGFSAGALAGGWSIVWQSGDEIREARIAHRAYEAAAEVTLIHEPARHPFVYTGAVAPFSFGFISTHVDDSDRLTNLTCAD